MDLENKSNFDLKYDEGIQTELSLAKDCKTGQIVWHVVNIEIGIQDLV